MSGKCPKCNGNLWYTTVTAARGPGDGHRYVCGRCPYRTPFEARGCVDRRYVQAFYIGTERVG